MNKIHRLLLIAGMSAGLLFATAGQADEIIIDIEELNQNVSQPLSWTHELEGFTLGSAVSGILTIGMRDDESDPQSGFFACLFLGICGEEGEIVTVIVGIIDFLDGSIIHNPNNPFSGMLGPLSLEGINRTGTLSVTLLPLGDFYVRDSRLIVTTRVASVPEPGTLGLLGLGLLGIGLARRRKA